MPIRNSGIVPCSVETCRYLTRPHRSTANTYPFPTRSRRKGMCHVCHYQTLPKPAPAAPRTKVDPNDPPNPATLAAHDTFLAGRREREARAARRALAATHPDLARKQATR